MDINRDSTDIHYNFGRWLACSHEIERRALCASEDKRETSAMRLFTKYAENPNKYMAIIENKIKIYERKLGGKAVWLQEEKNKIADKLLENPLEQVKATRHLDGRMILGFEAQMESFKTKGENERKQGGKDNERTDEKD